MMAVLLAGGIELLSCSMVQKIMIQGSICGNLMYKYKIILMVKDIPSYII